VGTAADHGPVVIGNDFFNPGYYRNPDIHPDFIRNAGGCAIYRHTNKHAFSRAGYDRHSDINGHARSRRRRV
jgi:hypothetical protein